MMNCCLMKTGVWGNENMYKKGPFDERRSLWKQSLSAYIYMFCLVHSLETAEFWWKAPF